MKKEHTIKEIVTYFAILLFIISLTSCTSMKKYSFKVINDTDSNLTKVGFSWGKMDEFISVPPRGEVEVKRNYRTTIFNFFGPGSLGFAVLEYVEDGVNKKNWSGGSIPRDKFSTQALNVFRIERGDDENEPFIFHISEE